MSIICQYAQPRGHHVDRDLVKAAFRDDDVGIALGRLDKFQVHGAHRAERKGGLLHPQQVFNELLYEIYYRFLETEDEYFDYAPAAVPPQGRWRIYGISLPDAILKKVYHDNAARLYGLPA